MIAIGDNNDDPFYRYKRPIAIIKSVHAGTQIINLEEISKSLHTKPKYILHWIKCKKSVSINDCVIKSKLDVNEIEKLINEFIEYIIVCPQCSLPELVISSDSKLSAVCSACGHSDVIPKNKFTKDIYKDFGI